MSLEELKKDCSKKQKKGIQGAFRMQTASDRKY